MAPLTARLQCQLYCNCYKPLKHADIASKMHLLKHPRSADAKVEILLLLRRRRLCRHCLLRHTQRLCRMFRHPASPTGRLGGSCPLAQMCSTLERALHHSWAAGCCIRGRLQRVGADPQDLKTSRVVAFFLLLYCSGTGSSAQLAVELDIVSSECTNRKECTLLVGARQVLGHLLI